jgi:hypothetical protein
MSKTKYCSLPKQLPGLAGCPLGPSARLDPKAFHPHHTARLQSWSSHFNIAADCEVDSNFFKIVENFCDLGSSTMKDKLVEKLKTQERGEAINHDALESYNELFFPTQHSWKLLLDSH